MPRRRLGVVLLVPRPLADAVDGLRRAFGDPALERVAPHITLVPPINVRESDLPAALACLRAAAAQARPLELTIGPVAVFPGHEHVGYLEVHGSNAAAAMLVDLARRAAAPPLDRPAEHDFVPHVTLTQGIDERRLASVMEASAGWTPQPTRVECLHLLEEQHEVDGRRWRPIADLDLAAAHIVGRGGLELELTPSEHLDPQARAVLDAAGALDEITEAMAPRWTGVSPLVVVARHAGEVVGALAGSVWGDGASLDGAWLAADGADLDVRRHLEAVWDVAEERHRHLLGLPELR
jgi:2'-5' RNA ligase